jgi:hypothetical protein
MPSLALLMFTRNDGDRAVASVRDLAGAFDEVVVIDSSDPGPFERLKQTLPSGKTRIHRVVPLGYVDLLRSYGLSKVHSDRVLLVDSDEGISEKLRAALPTLVEHDGYIVPRWESSLGVFTYHLRLYCPAAVRFGPRSWAYPIVDGSTGKLPIDQCLIHSADYAHYLDREDRAQRYMLVESFERPYTRGYARQALWPVELSNEEAANLSTPLSGPGVRALLAVEFVRNLLRSGSLKLARFHLDYAVAKASYLDRLPAEELARRLLIHREIREAEGLLKYLGFDDPAYVDRLTERFDWNLDGPGVLERLIDGRHRRGSPIESL